MIVTPIAWTEMALDLPNSVQGTRFANDWDGSHDEQDADMLAEFAGRACYQAWDKPNPKTATNDGYLANIISQGHFSVLEHSSVTFYVEGVSRSLTHELVRHRHLSYSELSQRYVDLDAALPVLPPAAMEVLEEGGDGYPIRLIDNAYVDARATYGKLVDAFTKAGLKRKQAREAARAVMPNAIETKIVVTGNLRAWRDMLGKRWHVAADAEIREFAGEVLGHLREIAPNSVQDIPTEPYGSE